MKKINWKIVNIALWSEIIFAYVLPFKIVDNFKYSVGFPISFLTIYNDSIAINPMMSMLLNPINFLINIVILYFLIKFVLKWYHSFYLKMNLIKHRKH